MMNGNQQNASQAEQGCLGSNEMPVVRPCKKEMSISLAITRGEALGTGLCALGSLMKFTDVERLLDRDEGECIINSLGYLIECIGENVLKTADDLRF